MVDRGGFSRAAEDLGLSQPAVSMQIKSLEEELGVTLLEREAEGVSLTKAGEILYAGARRAMEVLRETDSRLRVLKDLPVKSFAIGSSTVPSECLLPQIIGRLRHKFPDVRVTVDVGDTAEVILRVAGGQLQAGVVGAPPQRPDVKAKPVARDELVLVLPPDHPWENGTSVDPECLIEQPFVVREEGSGTRRYMEAAFEERGVPYRYLQVAAQLGSTRAVVAAVAAGVGVSLVSRMAIAYDLEAGRVKLATLTGDPIERQFYAIWRREEENLPLVTAFREAIPV